MLVVRYRQHHTGLKTEAAESYHVRFRGSASVLTPIDTCDLHIVVGDGLGTDNLSLSHIHNLPEHECILKIVSKSDWKIAAMSVVQCFTGRSNQRLRYSDHEPSQLRMLITLGLRNHHNLRLPYKNSWASLRQSACSRPWTSTFLLAMKHAHWCSH